MSSFAATEQRLAVTCQRYPSFPREPAVLVRLVKHIHKRLHDQANAALKPFGLNHPEYNLLMMLYGTAGGGMNPSQLADAAGEKSANITRLTNGLCDRGLIARSASAEDRRKIALTLTPEGAALIERLLPAVRDLLVSQVTHLSDSAQMQLEHLLKKMLAGLGD